jgi:predicted RNA-binding Zn-ribbon protein involved in translation (DUF1610 family)
MAAAWALNCASCNQRLAQFPIEETLDNYFFPQKPDFPEGGKEFECPNCGYKGKYKRADLT